MGGVDSARPEKPARIEAERVNFPPRAPRGMAALRLSSPAFEDGAEIPRRHGYKSGNAPPPLEFSGVPDGCRSLALVVDDPDALKPAGRVWVHWTVWNMPPGAGRVGGDASLPGGAAEGLTDFGSTGYGGPAPPDGRHTYVFTLYALDAQLGLAAGSDRAALKAAVEGHVIERAVLTGTYAP